MQQKLKDDGQLLELGRKFELAIYTSANINGSLDFIVYISQ